MNRPHRPGTLLLALALAGAAACQDKAPPPPAASSAPPAPAASSATAATAAPPASASPPPRAAASAVAVQVTSPIAVVRKHTVGQRYALEMIHSGLVTNHVSGTLTVTDVARDKITFALLVKSIQTNGSPRLSNTAFEATLVPPSAKESGEVDVKQLAGDSAALYLTSLESMVGDLCWTPKQPHKPGDRWKEREGDNETSWELVSVEREGDLTFARFKGDWAGKPASRHYELRLSTADGYAGTCRVDTSLDLGQGVDKQRYDITVRPL